MDHPTYARLFLGRRSDFAQQRADGGYWRVGRAITMRDLDAHLAGRWTLGSYVLDEQNHCRYAVFDADADNGLAVLHTIQVQLTRQAIPSYLERSRRGGHLWVFLATPTLAAHVRAWLLPFCPHDVEFYPKQAASKGYGSLIRLPLGVHRRSGKRYPFVEWHERGPVPVARTVAATLDWLTTVQLAHAPRLNLSEAGAPRTHERPFSSLRQTTMPASPSTIRAWCAAQDPFRLIGRYIALDGRGGGQCPFGEHHQGGQDDHSFQVYTPGVPGGYCWYCYAWQQGGSVFDFLRYWYGLDARDLWQRIQAEQRHTTSPLWALPS